MNDDELIYRRVVTAPRELVWRCLTQPGELARFWGPRGLSTSIEAIVEPATGMHTTSTLHDLGERQSEVVIHQRNVPEAMRLPQARAGFLTSLDKLEEHLAQLTQETGRG